MRKVIKFSVIFSFLLLLSCQQNQQMSETEKPLQNVQTEQTPSFSIESLSKAEKKDLDKVISPQTRETFDNAEQIVITERVFRQNSESFITKAMISDKTEKRELLNFLSLTATKKFEPIDCKGNFQNTIEADFQGKKETIKFELFCGFLSSDGIALADNIEFRKIVSKLIEKYGVDVQ